MMTRRGSLLLETLVAGAILGTLLAVCVALLSAAAQHRLVAEQRQRAIVELGNLMERVAARPWAELTESALAAEKISPEAAEELPGAELKIELFADPKMPDAKRITASLRWQDPSGQMRRPLAMTAWRYHVESPVRSSKVDAPWQEVHRESTKVRKHERDSVSWFVGFNVQTSFRHIS